MANDVDRPGRFDAELQIAVSALKAEGKKFYVLCVEGEDEDGAPTHWYPGDPDRNEVALGPLVPMEGGVADTDEWERHNPGYVELLTLMEEIQERIDESEESSN